MYSFAIHVGNVIYLLFALETGILAQAMTPVLVCLIETVTSAIADTTRLGHFQIFAASAILWLVGTVHAIDFAVAELLLWDALAVTATHFASRTF